MLPNTSSFLTLLLYSQRPWEPVATVLLHQSNHPFAHHEHLSSTLTPWKDLGLVLYLHACTSLQAPFLYPSLLVLLLFSFSVFLPRFLWFLHHVKSNTSEECCAYQVDDGCITSEGETEEEHDLFYVSDDCSGNEDLVADVVFGGQALFFLLTGNKAKEDDTLRVDEVEESCDHEQEDSLRVEDAYVSQPDKNIVPDESSCRSKMEDLVSEKVEIREEVVEIPPPVDDNMSTPSNFHTPNASLHDYEGDHAYGDDDCGTCNDETVDSNPRISKEEKITTTILDKTESLFGEEGKTSMDPKKVSVHEGDENNSANSSVAGSTSKSSCEWRGSTNFRDSETDGFFSSSSRRSSSNWESYAVYRKYDEEMMFFDRISTQKLRETESLRSIKVQPRSISERIVHKLTAAANRPRVTRNPYQELEAAYVAQICLAWEALNWNYKSFQRVITAERRKEDPGCPARVAQQFQQFQVLLQRYIENEPYEYGRRPEIYARMRISSPKLLQVPEFHGSEGEEVKEDMFSRISSARFLTIMEDVIQTFMSFLKADREKHWKQVLRAFTKAKPTSVDPSLLNLIKKAHRKKKARLKDLQRSRNCIRKRKLKEQDETEMLMGLIDMKVVSRVLRMPGVTEEQLHWCEEKMSRVRFWNGRVQRDSSPLFFPAP